MNGTGFDPRGTCPGPPVDTAASCAKPGRPNPQSQSLSRSYGSNLPTSLTYIILSTRGCSPWRPAADMGTGRRRDALTLPRIFKGRRDVSRRRGSVRRSSGPGPLSRAEPIPGRPCPSRRGENSPGAPRRLLRDRLRRRAGATPPPPPERGKGGALLSARPGSGI